MSQNAATYERVSKRPFDAQRDREPRTHAFDAEWHPADRSRLKRALALSTNRTFSAWSNRNGFPPSCGATTGPVLYR